MLQFCCRSAGPVCVQLDVTDTLTAIGGYHGVESTVVVGTFISEKILESPLYKFAVSQYVCNVCNQLSVQACCGVSKQLIFPCPFRQRSVHRDDDDACGDGKGHSCKIGNAPILEANIRFFMFLVF